MDTRERRGTIPEPPAGRGSHCACDTATPTHTLTCSAAAPPSGAGCAHARTIPRPCSSHVPPSRTQGGGAADAHSSGRGAIADRHHVSGAPAAKSIGAARGNPSRVPATSHVSPPAAAAAAAAAARRACMCVKVGRADGSYLRVRRGFTCVAGRHRRAGEGTATFHA